MTILALSKYHVSVHPCARPHILTHTSQIAELPPYLCHWRRLDAFSEETMVSTESQRLTRYHDHLVLEAVGIRVKLVVGNGSHVKKLRAG